MAKIREIAKFNLAKINPIKVHLERHRGLFDNNHTNFTFFPQEIHLRDIEDSLMTTILDFMYTGELSMTNENALDLFMLADRMELANLFTSCTKYIKDHIDANNCLGKYNLIHL